jgi:hypothetical protein
LNWLVISMAPRPPHKYFVVANFSRLVEHRTYTERIPASLVHAQTWGSLKTACGIACQSWTKWWDVPFPNATGPICPTCDSATRDASLGPLAKASEATNTASHPDVEKR